MSKSQIRLLQERVAELQRDNQFVRKANTALLQNELQKDNEIAYLRAMLQEAWREKRSGEATVASGFPVWVKLLKERVDARNREGR